MTKFSSRHGYRSPTKPRILKEQAPERVRIELRKQLIEDFGLVGAHKRVCEEMHRDPGDVFSASWAEQPLRENLNSMQWFTVYDLLEDLAVGKRFGSRETYHEEVNAALAEAGMAYEMNDGVIEQVDEAGELLDIRHIEDEVETTLTGKFKPVAEQYQKALIGLHGKPSDYKAAIRESLNALEAVTNIITGNGTATLGNSLKIIYGGGAPAHLKGLSASLASLYGYASTVPGARHGQHEEVEVSFDEALLSVRMSGSAIAFLIAENSSGRI